ncbi:hypothetical protein BCR34DRAFT_184315 [Clohesyomyces aquaticus]|uniref:Uncharacterized protein n=1 Tax=Clohesyomyces aquaticus TaxID=1231657 RepID=A0A1Y1ZYN1_9PLEO|nr:hypothetical protein BCR34DRAFT_184315 [Clohesyomyces aquaticus]
MGVAPKAEEDMNDTLRPQLHPKWRRVPLQNGTIPTSTGKKVQETTDAEAEKTPASIPQPQYRSVTVVPATAIPSTTTKDANVPVIPTGEVSTTSILQGYCSEPAYTILDGPTAYWVPVIGCISSKSNCCPTPTAGSGANPSAGPAGGAGAAFPISSFPPQSTLEGCPQDYHTVTLSGQTGCCPSSYWLWSTSFGGQVPCYSLLSSAVTAPPIPDTLAATRSDTAAAVSAKPTSAIVNIAYALQYPVNPPDKKPVLEKKAKIGVGVGVGSAAVILGVLIFLLVRNFFGHKKVKKDLQRKDVSRRFGSGVDVSQVAQQPVPPPVSRVHGGAKYSGVPNPNYNQY